MGQRIVNLKKFQQIISSDMHTKLGTKYQINQGIPADVSHYPSSITFLLL